MNEVKVLRVKSDSNPNSIAGAIAGEIKESSKVEIDVIGAGALNQAVKAVAISRGFVAPSGIDLICIPAFKEIESNGEPRTAIRLIIEQR